MNAEKMEKIQILPFPPKGWIFFVGTFRFSPFNLRQFALICGCLSLICAFGAFSPVGASTDKSASLTPHEVFLKAQDDLTAMRWKKAMTGFKKVLKDDPENLNAHIGLGEAEYYSRHFAEAQGYFEWVNSHDPDMPINHYYLGRVNYDQKRFEEAQAEMQAADRLDPQIAMVHYYLGLIRYKQKDVPGAQSELMEAVSLDPSSPKAHYALAYLLNRDLHKPKEALQEVNAALDGQPDPKTKEEILKLKKEIKK